MGNLEEIFSHTLGLGNSWSIRELVFHKVSLQLNIHLEFKKGQRFKMLVGEEYSTYNTTERTWQHFNFFQ